MNQDRKITLKIFSMLIALFFMLITMALYVSKTQDFFIDDTKYDSIITKVANKYNVDNRFIKAVIYQESKFQPRRVGAAGEIGLMQLMPTASVVDWAKEFKQKVPTDLELFDVELNVEIGAWYLAKALARWKQYKAQKELALCQYNAGESRANKWKPKEVNEDMLNNITIKSTKLYVQKVMNKYLKYCNETDHK